MRLKADNSSLLRTDEKFFSSLWQKHTSGGRTIDEPLKHIPPIYLGLSSNVEESVPRYYRSDGSELLSLILELRRSGGGIVKNFIKWRFAEKAGRCLHLQPRFMNANYMC